MYDSTSHGVSSCVILLRIADAFELMGSTFLLDMHDVGSTLFFWRKALQIRHNGRYIQSSPLPI